MVRGSLHTFRAARLEGAEGAGRRRVQYSVAADLEAFCWLGEMALFYTNDVIEHWTHTYQSPRCGRFSGFEGVDKRFGSHLLSSHYTVHVYGISGRLRFFPCIYVSLMP